MQSGRYLAYFLLFCSLLVASISAQIGEVAGPVYLNVSLGSNATSHFTIVNPTNTSACFKTLEPVLIGGGPNATTPNVTVTPLYGCVPPHSQYFVNVTAYMPSNDIVGLQWTGFAEALVVQNTSGGGGGAYLQGGVAKRVYINSLPAIVHPISPYVYAIAVVVLAVLAAAALKLRKGKKPAQSRRQIASMKHKASGKAGKKAVRGARKKSARPKKPARRPSRSRRRR